MPEPLVCEDSSLDRLLETVTAQPGSRILYQDTVRRGGMFGFFAREVHRVAYDIAEPDTEPATEPATESPDAPDAEPAASGPSLEDLLATADGIESVVNPTATSAAALDFAELLHSLTEHATEPERAEPPLTTPVPDAPVSSVPPMDTGASIHPHGLAAYREAAGQPRPVGSHRAMEAVPALSPVPTEPDTGGTVTRLVRPDARLRLDMLMQLRQVGVPVSVNPRADTHSLYEALEDILADLPAPAEPPRAAGQVLALVGESGPALQAARTLAGTLRIPENTIGIAGVSQEYADALDYPWISGEVEALRLRGALRSAELPSIVVVATDAAVADLDDPWARRLLTALRPTATWAVVDARWKTDDSRALLDSFGTVDALVVHSAQASASPAAVWDLDHPLGLLDDRSPTTFAWAGLLFRLLGTDARHRASA